MKCQWVTWDLYMFTGVQITGPGEFQESIYIWLNVWISWMTCLLDQQSPKYFYRGLILWHAFQKVFPWSVELGNVHAIWPSSLLTAE